MSVRSELENLKVKAEKALSELEDKYFRKDISEDQYKKWKNRLEEYIRSLHKQIEASSSEDSLAVERASLYEKNETQKLLTAFLDERVKRLIPIVDREYGVRYPEAERVAGLSALDTITLIDQLAESNILSASIYSKSIKCPRCRSNNVLTQYICPHCQSPDFDKGKIIEHLKCHYMDFELKFKKENELLCPRCNSVLKNLGVDYQKHGPWFKCSSCGKFFDEPLATYSCGDCGSIFELQQAVFYSLYSYTLNMNYIGEYEKVTIPLKRLEIRLAGSGWILKTPAFILGVSGLIHQFSAALWLKKEGLGVILPVDPDIIIEVYASSTAITAERVLSFAVKAQDIDCRIKLLVGIPRFESKAVELAEHYNVELLPVREREMFVETVANYILSRKVSERLQLQTVETAALENALKMLDEKLIGQGG
ncbi:MAG: hypothetical protein OdinLCB4_000610 [Candidatus Odinarchaeum yellowstonii]|uniref:Thaumarchaeal output domain-containing protein n=1 Tax=Odinarchaeota yellowstonii (strain LCB_4) TaxID=1841599 RepID=A0AAF0D2F2_ODILC|nr:MAG: hypothetical protein OdinLCB4_000610 [Candidatus Odinarchaeum yellowstonii]